MPSLASRVASEAPTFSPAVISLTSLTISTVPLLIFVGMDRACAKHQLTRTVICSLDTCTDKSCTTGFGPLLCTASGVCSNRYPPARVDGLQSTRGNKRIVRTRGHHVFEGIQGAMLSPHLTMQALSTTRKTICSPMSMITWKKLVWEGSSPVLPAGTDTSTGDTRPHTGRSTDDILVDFIPSLHTSKTKDEWLQMAEIYVYTHTPTQIPAHMPPNWTSTLRLSIYDLVADPEAIYVSRLMS